MYIHMFLKIVLISWQIYVYICVCVCVCVYVCVCIRTIFHHPLGYEYHIFLENGR